MTKSTLAVGDIIEQHISGSLNYSYKVVRTTKTQAIAQCINPGKDHTIRLRIAFWNNMVEATGEQGRNVTYWVKE